MFDTHILPIDKKAALIASQKNVSVGGLTTEQKRENYVAKIKKLEHTIMALPKRSEERKRLGKHKKSLEAKINELRPKMKCPNMLDYIVDVLREELSPFQLKRIIHKASERAQQEADKANAFK